LTTHELRGVPTRERGSEKRTCQWIGGKKCRNPMEAPHITWENRWFPDIFPLSQSIQSHICHQTIYLFEIVFDILYQQKHSIKLLIVGWCWVSAIFLCTNTCSLWLALP
jgi:hypothetical protein